MPHHHQYHHHLQNLTENLKMKTKNDKQDEEPFPEEDTKSAISKETKRRRRDDHQGEVDENDHQDDSDSEDDSEDDSEYE